MPPSELVPLLVPVEPMPVDVPLDPLVDPLYPLPLAVPLEPLAPSPVWPNPTETVPPHPP